MNHPDEIPLAPGENPPVPGAVKISVDDRALRHLTTRTKARKAALDILFEADLLQRDPRDVMDEFPGTLRPFTREIINGYSANYLAVDQRIAESLSGEWTLERMPRIDRCLAQIAVWELDFTDIDAKAAISEAIGLADDLSTDESVAYLNGLLGRVAKTRQQGG